ncbi:MAG TPA: hypothetical protein VGO89_10800, partial [Streptomyces sp.]|nr:hypothetical protein [Streptomyces sp.]
PLPLPPYDPPRRTAPLRVFTQVRGSGAISVRRFADLSYGVPVPKGETHTAVPEDTRDAQALDMADVIFRYGSADDPRLGGPARWTAEVLDRHPHSSLAAYVTDSDSCLVRTRDGVTIQLAAGDSGHADPAAYVSALHAWLSAGRSASELANRGLTVSTGPAIHQVSVTLKES